MAPYDASGLSRHGSGPAPARPVSLLRNEVLAHVALGTPLLCDALRLARWSAPSTPVSGPGVPDPDRARAAIERFGLWPYALVGDRAARLAWLRGLGAATEAAEFMAPWQAAVVLGLLEVDTDRARPAPGLEARVHDPDQVLEWWACLFDDAVSTARADLTGLGVTSAAGAATTTDTAGAAATTGATDTAGAGGAAVADTGGPDLLSAVLRHLYERPDNTRVPLASLARAVLHAPEDPSRPSSLAPGAAELLLHLLWQLSDTGAVILSQGHGQAERTAADPVDSEALMVELTDLGRYGVRRLLLLRGVPAPLAEDLAATGAAEFLDSLAHVAWEEQGAVIGPWLANRTPEEALEEVVEAVADPRLGARRRNGARILHMVGSRIGPRLRALLRSENPSVSGLAALVLLSSQELGREEADTVLDEYGSWIVVDMALASASGDDRIAAVLAFLYPVDLDLFLLERADRLWLCGHPDTVLALDALELHPDPTVAEVARKAARQARSRGL